MIKNKIHTKINDTSIQKNRFIGQFKGSSNGPTLIFVAGMHGNEPAGIFALRDVLKALNSLKDKFQGNLYALSGNLSALEKGIRYNEHDLNRLWTSEIIDDIEKHKSLASANEIIELKDIYYSIDQILKKEKGPFYFFDLHTTSSHSIPFITVNDSLLNREYTSQYPLPIVLGIEEFLNGALLSYINELGYIAFGFEGGQHEDPIAVDNHIAFIYLSMVFSGSLKKDEINFKKYYDQLFNSTEKHQSFYEIFQRYETKPFEDFKMDPGFINFQFIQNGQQLAKSNGRPINASHSCQIFMPLYQGKGNDGFFMIRKIPKVFLQISTLLRKIHLDRILPILPGVTWASPKKEELLVNLKIARFFTRKFLHLLGYRNKRIDKTHLRVKNREAASRNTEYPHF